MVGKKKVSDDDAVLFHEAMHDVKPLICDKVPIAHSHVMPFPKQRHLEEDAVRHDMLSDSFDPAELETGEELLFVRPGIQRSVLGRLRRGQFSIMGELDLHGMIVSVARSAVADFLRSCQMNNIRCVRIVHGKGCGSHQKRPVLKTKLNKWLRQRDEVLAFCSARPVDGGTGAVYVLVKRR
jgi:DNA-nicking Smr family endonuclease